MSDLQKDYDHLKKLYTSAEQAMQAFQKENAALQAAVNILEAEKRQWEQAKLMQQQIIQQALASANNISNGYLEEVQRLRAEIQALKK